MLFRLSALLSFLLASCASPLPAEPSPALVQQPPVGPAAAQGTVGVALLAPEPLPEGAVRGYMLAIAEGRLAIRDDCLVVETEGGGLLQPLMSTEDATWDDARQVLRFGARDYAIGDTIRMGGGGITRANLPARTAAAIPPCGEAQLWGANPL